MMRKLTHAERLLVRAESGVAEKTLQRWERGLPIKAISRERIERAIASLATLRKRLPKCH